MKYIHRFSNYFIPIPKNWRTYPPCHNWWSWSALVGHLCCWRWILQYALAPGICRSYRRTQWCRLLYKHITSRPLLDSEKEYCCIFKDCSSFSFKNTDFSNLFLQLFDFFIHTINIYILLSIQTKFIFVQMPGSG